MAKSPNIQDFSVYEMVCNTNESYEICQICCDYTLPSSMFECKNGHRYCKICLHEYFSESMNQFNVYPLRCPEENCNEDIYSSGKYILAKEEYARLKHLRRSKRLLKDPETKFCSFPNCRGYFTGEQTKPLICKMCFCEYGYTADLGRKEILETMPVKECPMCKSLIFQEFCCIYSRCVCDHEFCMKCGLTRNEDHKSWICIASDKTGKISWHAILFALYFIVISPFLPAFFIFLYRSNWNKNYFPVINEHPVFYFLILLLFSPMILVFGLFLLPFVWGWNCVGLLLQSTGKISKFWILLKLLLYLPSVLLVFIGILIGLGMLTILMPILGFALIIKKLMTSG